jgi:DNA-binding response OmpR family regulator
MPQRSAILIVEDDPAVRKFVDHILRQAGWKTIAAPGGREALDAALKYAGLIPLAIVDVIMPGMGGLDFANQLRIERPSTKILYISGSSDSVAVESIRQRAPQSLLSKPFTGAQLLERIRLLLSDGGVRRDVAS